ncbi:AI-2E family transporter [Aquisalimonas sp.]|uniref:AI-2E family transporter n=1 Tax=Aquisalimonas sp. TaxID=1872621 RepID=UPI0034530CD7
MVVLVQGRYFLIPLAIAVLLFSLTSAAVDRLTRLRLGPIALPNWLASLISILLVLAAMLVVLRILADQIEAVIDAGPLYIERGQQLVATMAAWLGDDAAAGIRQAFEAVDFGAYIRAFAGSAGYALSAAVLIVLYIGFLFAERARFHEKLARLQPDPARADNLLRMFRSITRSVHRYILVKSAVSVITGLVVYLVMRAFGLQFAETWALLTMLLNFIPNIGSIIATAIPTLVALVQFESWTLVVLLFATIGLIQFAVGNILEPNLMGRSLNLSPFVIILSLTFWGAVWGIIGMFLAVPIMVMLLIVCAHVPSLHPVAVLLSRDGVPLPDEEHKG